MQSSVNQKESRTFFGHPYPLGSLFFTEMWERFSFYGIRPLLILFMAATVYDGGMGLARENASAIVGIFAGTMYLAALPGGWLADNWLGQQRAVWYGSILIALGHLSIALSAIMGDNLFFIGLMFIVLGSGLFKTCISVMVGTLYKKGDDPSEIFDVRDFVDGDKIQRIHWKLSGKFDRLIVRDPALPITRNVLVFWERTGQSGNVKRIDAQAETVVSVCRSLADGGIQFTLGWNDTEGNVCVLHEICGMEDLVGVIPSLLRAAGQRDGVGGASLLVQTRPDALCGHMVYIGEEPCADVLQMQRLGHVTALLCGESPLEGSIPFDVGRYREQLGEIDV